MQHQTLNKTQNPFIVIVHYNSAGQLLSCIRSIITSFTTIPHDHIIIVDNLSTDGTLERVRKKYHHLEYIYHSHNVGFGTAANIGARRALERGATDVIFCNPDAMLLPGALTHLLAASNKKPGLYAPHIKSPAGTPWFTGGHISYLRQRALHDLRQPRTVEPYTTGYLSGCVLCVSAEVFRTIGLFDERFFLYYEDADFSLRAHKSGYPLQVIPQAVAVHTEQSEQLGEQKIYYLVLAGLLFFHKNTPWWLRPWRVIHTTLRRIKNIADRLRKKPYAHVIHLGFHDYGKAKKSPHFIPDRQL